MGRCNVCVNVLDILPSFQPWWTTTWARTPTTRPSLAAAAAAAAAEAALVAPPAGAAAAAESATHSREGTRNLPSTGKHFVEGGGGGEGGRNGWVVFSVIFFCSIIGHKVRGAVDVQTGEVRSLITRTFMFVL